MDGILSTLLSFPPHPPSPNPMTDAAYETAILEQISTIKKIGDSKLLLQTSGGEHALDVINPALNTVPYTFILRANIAALNRNAKGVDLDTLWQKMTNFLQTFDPRQMRYLMKEFNSIVESVALIADQNRMANLAVPPIRDAILRLDPSGSMLTYNHLILVKLALTTRAFHPAVAVLEKPIMYFPGSSSQPKPKYLCDMSLSPMGYITNQTCSHKFQYQDILEYFIFSGTVFIGMRDWENALQSLECAVTYPVKESVGSKIMVEAYKKWLLVGLLLKGKLLRLPKSTSGSVSKPIHTLAKAYETIAQIFEHGTAARLKSEVEHGQGIWIKDQNFGLVQQVLAAYQRFQIRKLADIYTKISVPEILSSTTSAITGKQSSSAQVVEDLIQTMINNGELHASLNRSATSGVPSILTFYSTGVVLTEAQMQIELAASTLRIRSLTQEIKETDRMLTYDKEYIKHMQKQKKNQKQGIEAGMNSRDMMEWNDSIEDEDIMGGY